MILEHVFIIFYQQITPLPGEKPAKVPDFEVVDETSLSHDIKTSKETKIQFVGCCLLERWYSTVSVSDKI